MRRGEITLPDTNVVLRYLLNDVPEQFEKTSEFFEKVRTGGDKAVILESVLVECVYILMKFYKAPKEEVAASLTGLLQYKGIVNRDKAAMTNALHMFSTNSLDIVDCVLLAKAEHDKMRLFTFDKSMVKIQKEDNRQIGD